jgi:uncharacterized metal-binding protein YceD (DUF177 family)
MSLTVDPRNVPAEGLHLAGSLPKSALDLPEGDIARPTSPLDYDLLVTRDGGDLIVMGKISATFDLQCGRCTEFYPQRVDLENYAQAIEIENEAPIDLTTWLREDILLALPTQPRCETGNVSPRECPAEGRFEPAPESAEPAPQEQDRPDVWGTLDQLTNLKRN